MKKGDPRGSFFVGIKEMSVFKKYGSGENLAGVMRFSMVLPFLYRNAFPGHFFFYISSPLPPHTIDMPFKIAIIQKLR